MQLATICVDQVLDSLKDASVSKLWRAKGTLHLLDSSLFADCALASSYASSARTTPFLSYFLSTTPDSKHKRNRLKTILFLHGSNAYDPTPIERRLRESEGRGALALEAAIVYGKASDQHI